MGGGRDKGNKEVEHLPEKVSGRLTPLQYKPSLCHPRGVFYPSHNLFPSLLPSLCPCKAAAAAAASGFELGAGTESPGELVDYLRGQGTEGGKEGQRDRGT